MKKTEKRLLSVFVVVAMLLSGLTYCPAEEKIAYAEETIAEIPEGHTPVRTIDELYAVRNNLTGKYILMNDIDLSEATAEEGELDTGHGWTPIQNFKGTFDGGGHRIRGMKIRGTAPSNYIGLFGSTTSNATVKNLGLVDVEINVNAENYDNDVYCGAIVGSHDGTIIEKCFTKGRITIK